MGLYAIVNLTQEIVTSAFAEMYRVLKTPGCLLISFHAGHEQLTVDNFLSIGESLWFQMFDPVDVIELLRQAGFESINCLVRDAYAQEYPTKRCYIRARKAE